MGYKKKSCGESKVIQEDTLIPRHEYGIEVETGKFWDTLFWLRSKFCADAL